MNQQGKDLTADKIKLIYEFNESSPLFARVADLEINRGNILEAINILEKGRNLYPTYPTTYFILALANAYAGREEEAKSLAAQGAEMLGSPKTLEHYNKKIDGIITERNSLSEADANHHVFTIEDKPEEVKIKEEQFEDKLGILADQLKQAKIIPKDISESEDETVLPETNNQKIVSDTMAQIYLNQKNYEEAIAIYEQLINLKPEKAEVYIEKILDIRSQMTG